mmetsp:Transcript_29450/g.80919  ORF Transcript_29450/g.80919 Transcript_29450/m.80919 type:complete len:591 (-) Transcript_29450:160-1932(-)|eukprot:CAMPEP_0168747620 /NCGR_PEP_ID=MMETSP0724-20121128/15753_1 /TAXON_ID=265536 /ORGANISM="Amphiprora sp., Strain CCMP467" /LENGTH=590 /DNA_ID=CAMNT_0008795421 /DNA_START=77 /DNA_END=1849 /DNA_ORIENTATION=+
MSTEVVDDNSGNAVNNDEVTSPRAPPLRQVSSIPDPKTKAGLFGVICNMTNSIVGAGIIGIPYALSQSGFVAGILLFILVAWLTDKSVRMIVELSLFHPKLKNLGVRTYEDLARIPFGRFGGLFVMSGMLVLAYGAMVSYLLIIKDTVPVIFGVAKANEGDFWEREFIMIVTSLIIVLPLSCMRDLANLVYTSFFSVLADIFLVGFVMGYSPINSSLEAAGGFGEVLKDNFVNARLFIGFGVMSFAMTVQHSAQLVANALENNTPERWAKVSFRSVALAAILCLLLGIFGYLGFLDDTRGNILNNFESDSVMANAGRALLAITMFFTYPMEAYVARHVLVQLIYKGDMDGNTIGPNAEIVPLPKMCGILGRREILTLSLYLASLLPALIVNDLGPVLSITGSLGASIVAYVASGMLYLGINGEEFLQYCREMLENHGYKMDKTPKPTEVELPVAGDAQATMATKADAESSDATTTTGTVVGEFDLPRGIKPWWWYLGGFPIWVAIARRGAVGTRNFLTQYFHDQVQSQAGTDEDGATHEVDLDADESAMGATKGDYYVSMFLIAFGLVATIVGIASNIYVQVNEVFYTPT